MVPVLMTIALGSVGAALTLALATKITNSSRLRAWCTLASAALLGTAGVAGLGPSLLGIAQNLRHLPARLTFGDLAQTTVQGALSPKAILGATLVAFAVSGIALWSGSIRKAWRILNPITRLVDQGPWQATWAPAEDTAALARNGSGLPIGASGGRLLRYLPNENRGWVKGHHAVISGTRGGKGVSAVLPAVLDHDGPVFALDVKGEIYRDCHADRARHRPQIVLDPFEVTGAKSAKFDPLTYVRDGWLDRDLPVLVDGLIRPETQENRWISNLAADLVGAGLAVVLRAAEGKERTLLTAVNLLQAGDLALFESWRDTQGLDDRVRRAAATVLAMGEKQRGTVLSYVRENLAWADGTRMRRLLAHSTIGIDQLLSGEVDLYVVVPPDLLTDQAGFLRVMMNLVLGAAIRRGAIQDPPELLVIADEFTRLGRLEKVLDIATVAAGYNLKALFIAQDLGSLDAVYGQAGRGTILGSCATVRVHGLGAGDLDTAEWVSRVLGNSTARTESKSGQETTTGEVAAPLLSPDQVLKLPYREQLLLVRGRAPLRTNRIISHSHPAYRNRLRAE